MQENPLEYYKTIEPTQATALQKKLRTKISLQKLKKRPQLAAGADISFNRGSDLMHAAIIVVELSTMKPVARSLVSDETPFPYIPGLLAFRELPSLWKAWQQLQMKPDVLIMDGHGLAHPRRMGVATHFGIEIDWPTMGCAKSILTGTHGALESEKGASVPLMAGAEQLGTVLLRRTNITLSYMQPGHHISFEDTCDVAMHALTKYKLPRTTRLAHEWANKLRREETEAGYVELR